MWNEQKKLIFNVIFRMWPIFEFPDMVFYRYCKILKMWKINMIYYTAFVRYIISGIYTHTLNDSEVVVALEKFPLWRLNTVRNSAGVDDQRRWRTDSRGTSGKPTSLWSPFDTIVPVVVCDVGIPTWTKRNNLLKSNYKPPTKQRFFL